MNPMQRTARNLFMTCTAMLIAACGGGETAPDPGGANSGNDPLAGINGGGRRLAQGPLTGFGSVLVNGVRYTTTSATILVGGAAATQANLATGQVVRVDGVVDANGLTGRADRIEYENTLSGPIDSLNPSGHRITVLGQTVAITRETVFGVTVTPGSITSLSIGQFVVISALRDSNGGLVATRLDRPAAPGVLELTGSATAVDAAGRRFSVNALVVDYSTATVEGFSSGAPATGDNVYVRGSATVNGVLRAGSVARRASGVVATNNDVVDLEGLSTRFVSATDFDVAGQRITTIASTAYIGDAATTLRSDAYVSVRGRYGASGELLAARIEVIPASNVEIEARIDAINTTTGVLRLLGIDVVTDARTRYDDDDQTFGLDDLRVGDSVDVAGYQRGGQLVAVRIGRDDDGGSEVEVYGPAAQLASPEFRVAGIRIVTDAQTEFDDGTATDFFANANGRIVEVEGSWDGSSVRAQEVELEE